MIAAAIIMASLPTQSLPPLSPPSPQPTPTPTQDLDCALVDSHFGKPKIVKLRSAWIEELKSARMTVIADETGVLPIGKELRDFDEPARGLWHGWDDFAAEGHEEKTSRFLYRVRISRDGFRGPRTPTGRAAMNLVFPKMGEGGTWFLDQYVGFCEVTPPNLEKLEGQKPL